MPFPEAKRVIYNKNPLDRVICQFRFPPILKIETEIPAEFQERIRKDFPEFREKKETTLSIPKRIQQEVPMGVIQQIMPSETKNYEFTSEDGFWCINLTRTFVALTSMKYKRREQFQEKLNGPLKALVDIYKPAYFSRIGLRYIDIIKRSVLELDNVDWSELLQTYILGLLGSADVSNDVQTLEAKYEIRLDDGSSTARIVTGLVEWEENHEKCFMIDTDFFNMDKTNTSEVMNKLDSFHVQASKLIRWLITNRLHEAMEPEEL
jgi:uncharacterized protein (TIGR04255 family)